MPTFCLYNLTMLGKVRLRRNDFLLFHPKHYINRPDLLKISRLLDRKLVIFWQVASQSWDYLM